MNPVLVELGLVPKSKSNQKQGNTNTNENQSSSNISAVDVLQQLLQSKILSADQVRTAYTSLQQENNNKSKNTDDGKQQQQQQQQPSSPPPDYRTRHIALRVYYEGKRYTGLAQNVGQESDQSIERQIFAALQKTRLIQSRESCGYSRCGRTDKGVSAVGQVIAMRLKSAIPLEASWDPDGKKLISTTEEEDQQRLPKNAQDTVAVWVPPKAAKRNKDKKNKKPKSNNQTDTDSNQETQSASVPPTTVTTAPRQLKEISEYPYEKMLNSLLPEDIRILGWCPVSEEFSARFSANTRTYRYFFLARNLDLNAMRQGLQLLVGKHDFRNFCKLNVVEVSNFVRTIHDAKIVCLSSPSEGDQDMATNEANSGVCYFQIQGQAFLWHQIRCIVSVLFLIGRGLEAPSVITELLNVEKHPGKPSYPLATEFPLVLHGCGYPNLHMGFSVQNLWTVSCQLEEQWETLVLEAARVRNCLELLSSVQMIQKKELVKFATQRLMERHKKQQRGSVKSSSTATTHFDRDQWINFVKTIESEEDSAQNSNNAVTVDSQTNSALLEWKGAIQWLARWKLSPDANGLRDHVHIPLLERSKGTTYEEKIGALQQSSTRRSQRYEENVAKKRKAEDGDSEFYEHMLKQGGSAV